MGPQNFMNYGLQMLMGHNLWIINGSTNLYELLALSINGSANFYELWVPNMPKLLWIMNCKY